MAATVAGSAVSPSAARTGSPGIRWMIRKENVTSTHTEMTRRPNRRMRNLTHGLAAPFSVLVVLVEAVVPVSATLLTFAPCPAARIP